MIDILSLKVEEIVAKIKDAQLTSVEVCQKYIERINEFEKDVRAWVHLDKKLLIEKLKDIDTRTDLKFHQIEFCGKKTIKVSYYGHEVGGSYVHDYQVTPKYVEDIQYTVNRQAYWTKRTSGGFGNDIYHFIISTDKIVCF